MISAYAAARMYMWSTESDTCVPSVACGSSRPNSDAISPGSWNSPTTIAPEMRSSSSQAGLVSGARRLDSGGCVSGIPGDRVSDRRSRGRCATWSAVGPSSGIGGEGGGWREKQTGDGSPRYEPVRVPASIERRMVMPELSCGGPDAIRHCAHRGTGGHLAQRLAPLRRRLSQTLRQDAGHL